MPISIYGGPFDGSISEGPSPLPLYIVATNHHDQPIYKRACCCKCSTTHKAVPYVFVGYERQSNVWMEQELPELSLN